MRGELKRYHPTFLEWLRYRWGLVLDFWLQQNLAQKPVGPWCVKCGEIWPRGDTVTFFCVGCGVVDGAAKALEEDRRNTESRLDRARRGGEGRGSYRQEADAVKRDGRKPGFTADDIKIFASMSPLLAVAMMGIVLTSRVKPWWRAFDLQKAPASMELAKVAYHVTLKAAHPDRGGSEEEFQKVRNAWKKAERYYAKREASQAENSV